MSAPIVNGHHPFRALSYLSPNMQWLYENVFEHWAVTWGYESIRLETVAFDPMEDPILDGEAEGAGILFMCGLPLMRRNRAQPGVFYPLAAPVMSAPRYDGKPVYFADVIVRADSSIQTFADLRGSTFAYNDAGSQSGYNSMRYHLIQQGLHTSDRSFFRATVKSGGHLRSIPMVLNGEADCAAIDSLVLDQVLRDDPRIADRLRVVQSLGPYPNPPIITSKWLYELAFSMDRDPSRNFYLFDDQKARSGIDHYTTVRLSDYQILLEMYDVAEQVGSMTIL